ERVKLPLVDQADLVELDPRVFEGIDLINRGEYFEAHEAIEAAWLEEFSAIRPLYQGLIQVAVSLHHLRQNNLNGAIKLYRTSKEHLLPFGEVCKGIRVGRLLKDMDHLFAPILLGERP